MRTKEELLRINREGAMLETIIDIRDLLADLTGAMTQLVAQGNREENSK